MVNNILTDLIRHLHFIEIITKRGVWVGIKYRGVKQKYMKRNLKNYRDGDK